jgi:PAS domain S-box-containing protein
MSGLPSDLESFFELSADIIYQCNRRGNFTFANPAVKGVLGYEPAEVIGLHFTELIRADYREKVRQHYVGMLQSSISRTYLEFPCLNKDGSEVWIGQHVQTVVRDGRVTGFQAVARDVSDRTALEAALAEARDAALASAKMRGEFLANMSHELRTPMNGVLGMLGVLLDSRLDEDQREVAETAKASAESLLTLLNDILDLSKIESRKLTFENAEFDISEALDGVIDLLADSARKKGIEVGCSVDSDVPRRLRGDAGRLRQILVNLIGNAIKFTASGGVVARVGLASRNEDKATLLFKITDTGIGISAETCQRLFRPFVQADASTTRRFGGTGLGLAICRELVEMMNGEIGVESELGQGSTFWFTAELEARPQPAVVSPTFKPRVLIVDDSQTARALMSLQLRTWEAPNDVAAGGLAALKMLQAAAAEGKPYGVVISDLNMADMDGLMLARTINGQFGKPKVIIVSGTAAPCDKASLASRGVAVWLIKPVKPRQLEAAVFGQSAPAPKETGPLPSAPISPRGRILVVEDNPVNQKVALRQLQKLGYSADIAANGLEALEAVRRLDYAAVLMDCHMPEMDGFEATRILRSSGSTIPIIALTASAQAEDRERCHEAGMNDFITKPTREADLTRVLARWAADERQTAGSSLDPDSLSRLNELAGDDDGFIDELFSTYLEQADKLVAALNEGDGEAFVRTVHALNGSSRNIGAAKLAELCRTAELDRGRGRPEHTAALVTAYGRLRQELMTRMTHPVASSM